MIDQEFVQHERAAREGVFDAQLSFPPPFVDTVQPISSIRKRDGSAVAFDARKIAESIFLAARSVGEEDWDRSRSLATGVTLYLLRVTGNDMPTAKQAHATVERVLREMGYHRAAQAYLSFRDRRDFSLEWELKGDVPPNMNRKTPQNTQETIAAAPTQQEIRGWDRNQIAITLMSDDALSREHADFIAMEVECQIRRAGLNLLTPSLVCEWVSATLLEHGMECNRQRYMGAGTPHHELERMICLVDGHEEDLGDPAASDLRIAKRVKGEFALTKIFSRHVADAHERGDLHLHNLGSIDRIESICLSLPCLNHARDLTSGSPTDRSPSDGMLAVMAKAAQFTATLERHTTSAVGWDALNVHLGPYLATQTAHTIEESARHFFECFDGRRTRPALIKIGLAWDLPEHLNGIALTMGGAKRFYADSLLAARHFARSFLKVHLERHQRGFGETSICPVIDLTPGSISDDSQRDFLLDAVRLVSAGARVQFRIQREEPFLPHTEDLLSPRNITAQTITLNLPRAAYRGVNEAGLENEIDRLLEIAITGHIDKRSFLERLLSYKSKGPLYALTRGVHGRPWLDMGRVEHRVGITGLNECVNHLTGNALHESEESMGLAERIMAYLRTACERVGQEEGFRVVAAFTDSSAIAQRFAKLDLQRCSGLSQNLVQPALDSDKPTYTPGRNLSSMVAVEPSDAIRMLGRFGMHHSPGAATLLSIKARGLKENALLALLEQALMEGHCGCISFINNA